MTDEELVARVNTWFDENHRYFNLDKYYGINVTNDILHLLIEVRDAVRNESVKTTVT